MDFFRWDTVRGISRKGPCSLPPLSHYDSGTVRPLVNPGKCFLDLFGNGPDSPDYAVLCFSGTACMKVPPFCMKLIRVNYRIGNPVPICARIPHDEIRRGDARHGAASSSPVPVTGHRPDRTRLPPAKIHCRENFRRFRQPAPAARGGKRSNRLYGSRQARHG